MQTVFSYITIVSDTLAAVASGIAIYLFFFKKKEILEIYAALKNYAQQLTISELKLKLALLKDLDADETANKTKVKNLISEIVGQIQGNKKIYPLLQEVILPWEKLLEDPKNKLTQSDKCRTSSQLDEKLKHIFVENFDVGGKNNG